MKQILSSILRKLKLMSSVDLVFYHYQKIKNKSSNQSFLKDYPSIKLPPDYLMYESFQLNYRSYYFDSKESAKWLVELITPYKNLNSKSILDWGCGPGRIVRHLPDFVSDANIYGSDYNKTSIDWCQKNIPNVKFDVNGISPPLNYSNNQFDFIYGISIFTHLSDKMHHAWIQELSRVLKVGGVLMLTTHGDSFKRKLTKNELLTFDMNKLVIRGNTFEGHRSYVAFQPMEFFKTLLSDFNVLKFIEGNAESSKPQQDIWILEKKKPADLTINS